jgi:hypothetical protein
MVMNIRKYFPGTLTDIFVRYSLAVLLFIISYDDILNFSELQDYISLVTLPRGFLPFLIAVQLVGAVLLILGCRVLITAIVLAVIHAINAVYFDSDFAWVLMVVFLVLALHSHGKSENCRFCGPLTK